MDCTTTSLWVFGYGSLCWYPGFQTRSSCIGYVQNYVRRFWQGNTTHRGHPGRPGRVATLIKEDKGLTWGVAYEVTGEAALKYLNEREVTLGGYTTELVTFYPRDRSTQPFPVLLYIATPSSKDWAGPAPLHEIATQIIQSKGPYGHNVEYLVRLADFMREKIPEEYDEHLSTLETLVRNRIKENNMCLKSLMGEGPPSLTSHENGAEGGAVAVVAEDNNNNNNNNNNNPQEERRNTFSYSTQVPKKTLRCLNV
ncbi:UNVERIFIED_CONTAM: hypothetical protein RMT77_015560 [Armadillidium vulgare]